MKLLLTNQKKTNRKDLPVGTVFEYEDGTKGLVFDDECGKNHVLLLTYCDNSVFFRLAAGYLDYPIKKVLGKINTVGIG